MNSPRADPSGVVLTPGRQNFAKFLSSSMEKARAHSGFCLFRGLVVAGESRGRGGAKVLEGCQGLRGKTCISFATEALDAATTKGRKGLALSLGFHLEPLAMAE